ncbi:hypothetical protein VR010_12735 [Actinomycetaceae bacterium L2_0104]
MSDTPAPRPPLDPQSALAGLEEQDTDEQIRTLDEMLEELSRRLSRAQG